MKTSDILILGGLAFGLLALSKKASAADATPSGAGFETIPAGYETPGGNKITETIHTAQEGVDYINQQILGNSLRTSLDGKRLLAPRAGGGYTQVGAANVTLKPNPKPAQDGLSAVYNPVTKKYTINQNGNSVAPKKSAPWNKYYGGKKK